MTSVTREHHRLGYSVEMADGTVVQPIGLGDVGGDNYEHLYLDTEATALRVSMKSNLLMDPRSDAKPATSVEITGTKNELLSSPFPLIIQWPPALYRDKSPCFCSKHYSLYRKTLLYIE